MEGKAGCMRLTGHGKEKECIKSFGGKARRKETIRKN
jgi:hypothetical protein